MRLTLVLSGAVLLALFATAAIQRQRAAAQEELQSGQAQNRADAPNAGSGARTATIPNAVRGGAQEPPASSIIPFDPNQFTPQPSYTPRGYFPVPGGGPPGGGPYPPGVPMLPNMTPLGPAGELMREDQRLEQEVQSLTRQLADNGDHTQRAGLKEKLAATLEEQFDAQQKLRELEVSQIEARVQKLRDLIHKRSEARRKIIDNRYEQLLNDAEGLGWNSAGGSDQTSLNPNARSGWNSMRLPARTRAGARAISVPATPANAPAAKDYAD